MAETTPGRCRPCRSKVYWRGCRKADRLLLQRTALEEGGLAPDSADETVEMGLKPPEPEPDPPAPEDDAETEAAL